MFLLNTLPSHNAPLASVDAESLGERAADTVERFLAHRANHAETPLHALPALAPNSASAPSTSRMKAIALGWEVSRHSAEPTR